MVAAFGFLIQRNGCGLSSGREELEEAVVDFTLSKQGLTLFSRFPSSLLHAFPCLFLPLATSINPGQHLPSGES
jgi:hypothetical protein